MLGMPDCVDNQQMKMCVVYVHSRLKDVSVNPSDSPGRAARPHNTRSTCPPTVFACTRSICPSVGHTRSLDVLQTNRLGLSGCTSLLSYTPRARPDSLLCSDIERPESSGPSFCLLHAKVTLPQKLRCAYTVTECSTGQGTGLWYSFSFLSSSSEWRFLLGVIFSVFRSFTKSAQRDRTSGKQKIFLLRISFHTDDTRMHSLNNCF